MTAVAEARTRADYMATINVTEKHLSADERRDLERELVRESLAAWYRSVSAARVALARVRPYRPDVEPYYADRRAVEERTDEIITLLMQGPRRHRRRRLG